MKNYIRKTFLVLAVAGVLALGAGCHHEECHDCDDGCDFCGDCYNRCDSCSSCPGDCYDTCNDLCH